MFIYKDYSSVPTIVQQTGHFGKGICAQVIFQTKSHGMSTVAFSDYVSLICEHILFHNAPGIL